MDAVHEGSEAAEFLDAGPVDAGGDEVTEGVGGIVPAEPLLVDIGLEDIGGVIGVVLEEGEAIEEPVATFVDEEGGFDAGGGVAEALLDGGPALDAVGIGGTNGNGKIREPGGEGAAIELGLEQVAAGGNLADAPFIGIIAEQGGKHPNQ